jgi:hypothetical protein
VERDKISAWNRTERERDGVGVVASASPILPSESALVRKVPTITETEPTRHSATTWQVGRKAWARYPAPPVSRTMPGRGSLHARVTKPYLHITVPSRTRHRTSPPPRFLAFAVWQERTSRLAPCVITKYESNATWEDHTRSPTVVTPHYVRASTIKSSQLAIRIKIIYLCLVGRERIGERRGVSSHARANYSTCS